MLLVHVFVHVLLAMQPHQQQPPRKQQQQQQRQQGLPSLSALLGSQLAAAADKNNNNNNDHYRCRIFLMRHGETDWNVEGKLQGGGSIADIALNEKGKQQAARLMQELQNSILLLGTTTSTTSAAWFNVIASSHLQRACQTADALMLDSYRTFSNSHSSHPAAEGSSTTSTSTTSTSTSTTTTSITHDEANGNSKCRKVMTKRLILTGFREMDYGMHEGLCIRKGEEEEGAPAANDDEEAAAADNGTIYTNQQSRRQQRQIFEQYANPMQAGDLNLAWPGGGESIYQVEQRAMAALHQVLQFVQEQEQQQQQSSSSFTRGEDCSNSNQDKKENNVHNGDDKVTTSNNHRPTTTTTKKTNMIAIVAHAILNRILLAVMLRGDARHFVDYEQDNCCINVIDQLENGTFRAVVINYTQHMVEEKTK